LTYIIRDDGSIQTSFELLTWASKPPFEYLPTLVYLLIEAIEVSECLKIERNSRQKLPERAGLVRRTQCPIETQQNFVRKTLTRLNFD